MLFSEHQVVSTYDRAHMWKPPSSIHIGSHVGSTYISIYYLFHSSTFYFLFIEVCNITDVMANSSYIRNDDIHSNEHYFIKDHLRPNSPHPAKIYGLQDKDLVIEIALHGKRFLEFKIINYNESNIQRYRLSGTAVDLKQTFLKDVSL